MAHGFTVIFSILGSVSHIYFFLLYAVQLVIMDHIMNYLNHV